MQVLSYVISASEPQMLHPMVTNDKLKFHIFEGHQCFRVIH